MHLACNALQQEPHRDLIKQMSSEVPVTFHNQCLPELLKFGVGEEGRIGRLIWTTSLCPSVISCFLSHLGVSQGIAACDPEGEMAAAFSLAPASMSRQHASLGY